MAAWHDWPHIVWNGAWLVVWTAALVVAWRTPRTAFGGEGRAKWLWLFAVGSWTVGRRGYWVPVGAVAFLLGTPFTPSWRRRAASPTRGSPPQQAGTGRS